MHHRPAHRAQNHSLFGPLILAALAASILITGLTPVRVWQTLAVWMLGGAVALAVVRLRNANETFEAITNLDRPAPRPGVERPVARSIERQREELRDNRWPR